MKKYILYVILGIIFVLLVSVLLKPSGDNTITPTGGGKKNKNDTSQEFTITRVLPPEDTSRLFPPIQQVAFVFSEPISPEGLVYSVEPFISSNVRQGPDENTVIVSSDRAWIEGITTIIVSENTTSMLGKKLNNFFEYKMQTGFPVVDPDWPEWPI